MLLFALVGRSSHDEATDPIGVLGTAWPFLTGYVVGVLVSRLWRQPDSQRTGVVCWLCTVSLGILLRLASGDTAQWTFVLVATAFLASGLLGWRFLLRISRRAGPRRAAGRRRHRG